MADAARDLTSMSGPLVRVNGEMLETDLATGRAAQTVDRFRERLLYLVSAANGLAIVRRAFQQTYQAVKELDDVMTEMAVVTDLSVGDY